MFTPCNPPGNYGTNVGFDASLGGVAGLEAQLVDGSIKSSLTSGLGPNPTVAAAAAPAADDDALVATLSPTLAAGASAISFSEDWTVTLGANDRSFTLDVAGSTEAVDSAEGIRCLRRNYGFGGASVYAWWAGGHVQMKDQVTHHPTHPTSPPSQYPPAPLPH